MLSRCPIAYKFFEKYIQMPLHLSGTAYHLRERGWELMCIMRTFFVQDLRSKRMIEGLVLPITSFELLTYCRDPLCESDSSDLYTTMIVLVC